MLFWIVAAGLALAVTGLIALALLRAQDAEAEMERFDIRIYRDQLAAVDKDLARGLVGEEEAERLRTEIKRRILEADRASAETGPTGRAPKAATLVTAALSGVAVLGGSLWLYTVIGAPAYPDMPLVARLDDAAERRATRPTQAQAEASLPSAPDPSASADFLELMDRLRATVAERPSDLDGHRLLARNEAGLGNFAAAHAAQKRVIEILGPAATARDWADYGDLMVLAAGGYVSPEAERAFEEALARDPGNGTARYYMGAMQLQTGRPDLAFRIWQAQLREGPADAPWIGPIRAQIEQAAARAGIDYRLPPAPEGTAPRGPAPSDVEAAEGMSPAERMQMIEGMVSGLSERLATTGGPPEDWARLIRAYGVLGRREQAAAIWAEAQQVFEDEVARLPILRAARDAGVAQ
ncbi:c-type cytochrome biogenesis protein CcmI [Rhodovulum sp. 12E13]|uniref:c-type cytochrome biogenesis protein CcmI n=1 Tax=Rhodovulum sp. 12E13 TaxID=2203891 RepID=UPI000E15E0C6|nr:c-type cytochrome biogenesis protein CcmI [Rhodovulum sp. 12E13]RDC73047.1 c-type cytochrome biogenesis protein CcmI [Rhodovulum sp. 12E13]